MHLNFICLYALADAALAHYYQVSRQLCVLERY